MRATRVIGCNDLVLKLGLGLMLLVVASGPIGQLLDPAHGAARGLLLLQALCILATVFALHQLFRRRVLRDEAEAAAKSAKDAAQRTNDMSRIVGFGRSLAQSMEDGSHDSIRDVAAAHIPQLAPGRAAWVMIRNRGGQWESLMAVGESSLADRERSARAALGEVEPAAGPAGEICFPMSSAGAAQGVLGVAADPPLTEHQRSVISVAAALLAVSLKNAQLLREVRENSVRDGLTGCFNRSHALDVLDGEIRRARRSKLPLSVIMFDLDHFKAINDRHGHLAGDAVLASVGATMRATLRGSDLKCRYGGDEFMVILPDTPLTGARQASETLRGELESHLVAWNDQQLTVTASFGVATVASTDPDPTSVIARADAALYRAKQRGRNGVQVQSLPALI